MPGARLRRGAAEAVEVEDVVVAWLPEHVRAQLPQEVDAFAKLVQELRQEWQAAKALPLVDDKGESTRKFDRFLKWPSVVRTYVEHVLAVFRCGGGRCHCSCCYCC